MTWNRGEKETWVKDPRTGEVFPLSTENANEYDRYWSVKTNYPNMDELFRGFKSGNLVGIGGKHALGKSALAVNLALNMADHGTKVCLFSFELSCEDVVTRLLARMTGIEMSTLLSGDLFQDQYENVEEKLGFLDSIPLEICDSPSMTVDSIRETARDSLHGCSEGILIIDCLELIQPSKKYDCYDGGDSRLESIVISLKRMAKELRVPVIVTTHLDRTDGLGDAYPLSEHADIVMFLDHAKDDDSSGERLLPMDIYIDIYIAKFRQGPAGNTLRLAFFPDLMWFVQIKDSRSAISEDTTPPWIAK